MDDLRARMARDLDRLRPSADGLEQTLRRVRLRRRRRRLMAGALGLVLTAGLVGGLWSVVRPGQRPGPAVSPLEPAANGPIWFEVTGEGQSPDYGVWQIEPDGTGLSKVLDFSRAGYWQIAWSPDGRRIAYVDTATGGISTSNPDGSGARRVTDGVNDAGPSWSPAGSEIAFSGSGADHQACVPGDVRCPTDIYVMNADGTDVRQLTDDQSPEYQPAWSPDGTRIAFVRAVDTRMGEYAIEVMNADGSDVMPVTLVAGGSAHPSWSPDGTRLAFVGHPEGVWGVYTVHADGSHVQLVERETGSFTEGPVWSPDGTRIAFVSDRGGVPVPDCGTDGLCSPQVYLVNPDGTGLERLTAVAQGVGQISWRPLPAGTTAPTATAACFDYRATGDFDGDGLLDVAVAAPTVPLEPPGCRPSPVSGEVTVSFGAGGSASMDIPCIDADCGEVRAIDFDGDGRAELVVELDGGAAYSHNGVYRATPDGVRALDLQPPGDPRTGLVPGPFVFDDNVDSADRGGATCQTDATGHRRLIVSVAGLSGRSWSVHRAVVVLTGDRFSVVSTSETTSDSPPNVVGDWLRTCGPGG